MASNEPIIRNAVVAKLRDVFPEARIIHELNMDGMGSNRADVVAATDTEIVIVEIKSNTDTLKRLQDQADAFAPACHQFIIAVDDKHCDKLKEMKHLPDYKLWAYRNNELIGSIAPTLAGARPEPRTSQLLRLCWQEELIRICKRNRVATSPNMARKTMIDALSWYLTGEEVTRAVCKALRCRSFAVADDPINVAPAITEIENRPDLF